MFDNIPFISKKSEEKREENLRDEDFNRQKELELQRSSAMDDNSYFHMQEGKSDLIRWQQELDGEIFKMVMHLKGYAEEGGEWVETNKPLCNDKFIYGVIIPLTMPFMSKNMINSRFDIERIYKTMEETSNDFADAIADGWDKYDIDFTDYDVIVRMFKTGIMASIQRAQSGWTKKVDSSMIKMSLIQNERDSKDKTVNAFLGG